jgi:hypothetical protein
LKWTNLVNREVKIFSRRDNFARCGFVCRRNANFSSSRTANEETLKVIGVVSVLPGKLSVNIFLLKMKVGEFKSILHKSFPFCD